MKTSSASDGTVWIVPAMARITCPTRRLLAATMPSGIDTRIAEPSETTTRNRCSPVCCRRRVAIPSRRGEDSTPNFRRRNSAATSVSGTRSALARAFIRIIFVLEDLRIGGVKICRLNGVGGQRSVGDFMVQPAHLALRKMVTIPQRRPAFCAVHEFVAKAELQFRVPRQIGKTSDAEPSGDVSPHSDRVAIVEPERGADPDTAPLQSPFQAGEIIGLRCGQKLLGDGSGVLRIDLDLSFDQRIPQNPGPPELTAVDRANTAGLQQLRRYLSEQHRFGEGLGTHPDRRPDRLASAREQQRDTAGKEQAQIRPAAHWPRSEEHTSELQSLAYLVC